MKPITPILVLTLFLLPLVAKVEASQDLIKEEKIDTVLASFETTRKELIASNMDLTEDGERFWALYNEFQAKRVEAERELFELIVNYGKDYQDMTDTKAQNVIVKSIEIEDKYLNLKKDYIAKFGKIISPIQNAPLRNHYC